MTYQKLPIFLLALLLAGCSIASLKSLHKNIESKFKNVEHLESREVEALEEVIFFDVREVEEFEVSHIAGARRLDPSLTRETFFEVYGEDIEGKTTIFYCSVGMRSSELVSRLAPLVKKQNGTRMFNLEGGIFTWYNEGRALVDQEGEVTNEVHPYNKLGEFFLERNRGRK